MRISLPEQTWLDYEPATFGSRGVAFAIDLCLRWLIFLLLIILFYALLSGLTLASVLDKAVSGAHNFFLAVFIFLFFLLEWVYQLYFDVFCDGVSPGKKLLGLRVVDERALPVTWQQSFIRTLLRVVDLLPGPALTAFVCMVISKKCQRVGDIAAKTIVVHEIRDTAKNDLRPRYTGKEILLPLELFNLLEKFLQRSAALGPEAREKISASLASRLSGYTTCPQNMNTFERREGWLRSIYAQARPVRAGAHEQREDAERWKALGEELPRIEETLAALTQPGMSFNAPQLLAVGRAYQTLCQRYAYLSTYYPDSPPARAAARLVRWGRRLIYGKRLKYVIKANVPVLTRVSYSFLQLKAHFSLALCLFVLGAGAAWLLVQLNPEFGWRFLSEEAAADLAQGKLWTDKIQGMNSIASSQIMTNNIQVSLIAFALGVTGGVGTVVVMLFNGAMIGGVFSALTRYGMAGKLFNFVAAHGFLELSVIFVAAGCGLYFADALIRPGFQTRARALQKNAAACIELMLFNAVALIVAGLVEGHVSPHLNLALEIKLVLGLLLFCTYWSILLLPALRNTRG